MLEHSIVYFCKNIVFAYFYETVQNMQEEPSIKKRSKRGLTENEINNLMKCE